MRNALSLIFCLFVLLAAHPARAAQGEEAISEKRHLDFSRFSVDLPAGWDGDEQSGFISDNPAEYALTFGRKDESGDSFVAQVTVYLLPNKPGAEAEAAARTLTESQADPTDPEFRDGFWVFEGEPRSNAVKGRAVTMVNADPEYLLIIIAQDPANLGARAIIDSLRGQTPEARRMLGR